MKRKQDIEKIFQDNQHQLDERPSGRAWERLESRLDGNRSIKPRPRPAFRLLSMAATLLFLVATIALMTTLFRTQNKQTASAETLLPTPVMEELTSFDNSKGVYTIAVSFQHYLNQKPTMFAEGAQNKKLIPPSKINSKPPVDKGFLAKADMEKQKKKRRAQEEQKAMQKVLAPATAPIASGQGIETAKEQAEAAPYSAEEDIVLGEAIAFEAAPSPIEYGTNSTSTGAPAPDVPVTVDAASEEKVALEEASTYSRARQAERIDLSSNSISYDANPTLAGVDQFQWLIGQWQAPLGNDRQTIEQWQQKDQFTIEGSGQLVVNGDTTFTEGMKIQKIGENLYYILALDENNKEVRFQLRALQSDVAIFETEEKGVPKQLIIQQHNANNFSTTLQNPAPAEIEETQRTYLQNRNNIELNQRTVRNLSRVNKD